MKISGSTLLVVGAVAVLGTIGVIKTSSIGVAQDAPASTPQSTAVAHIEGSVSKVFDVPGYTYVEVEAADGAVWAAAPSVSVQVGDSVSFSTGMAMRDFYSKTLQREFSVIYFVDGFISNEGMSSFDSEAAVAHGRVGEQAAVAPVQGIRKADGGYTIAEIYARGDELSGKPMRVRGQVVKFTAGVMNTNWIRIRDGSTTDDLVVPADATVTVNDIVLVEGTLVINMDLGQGYIIPAVLDDAEVTIE